MSGTGRNNTVDLNVSNPVLKACIYSLFFCIDCKAACVDLRTIAYTGFGLIICIDNRECCTYSGTALSCAASRSLSTGLILLIKLCTGKSCSPCAGCQLALLCGFYFYIAVRVNNSTITDLSCSSCIEVITATAPATAAPSSSEPFPAPAMASAPSFVI